MVEDGQDDDDDGMATPSLTLRDTQRSFWKLERVKTRHITTWMGRALREYHEQLVH